MSYWKNLAAKATIPRDHKWIELAKSAIESGQPNSAKELAEDGELDDYAIAIADAAWLEYESRVKEGFDKQDSLELAMQMLAATDSDDNATEDWEIEQAQSEQTEQLMDFLGARQTPEESGDEPEVQTMSVEFDESKHPRGKPGNKGQFTEKESLSSLESVKEHVRELFNSGNDVFVRWSVDPMKDQHEWGGTSKDSVSGKLHEGLSAVRFDPDWFKYSDASFIRVLSEYGFTRIKNSSIKPWVVSGEQLENMYGDKLVDSDGYPLIKVKSCTLIDVNILDKIGK